jgi:metal-responsive CopG/Arc/MetJ family transcriptional regulator
VVKVKRLNITIPEELAQEIKDLPNKSRFIAQALREKLERVKREKLDSLLIEGYKATREEDKRIDIDWEKITLEGWQ